ncbi:MAG: iron donor protein CyaY [Moraxellaceae bacterium]|jgi:CyaY protein|nr:iron donor protein CyaY [Moraxellaceae bacterium]
MNESEFNTTVDGVLLAIEDALEDQAPDIDMETSGGILTLTFTNGSKVIVNRQTATREIWVAARSGGFHCGLRGDTWTCTTTGETLAALLSRVCTEQAGEPVRISL